MYHMPPLDREFAGNRAVPLIDDHACQLLAVDPAPLVRMPLQQQVQLFIAERLHQVALSPSMILQAFPLSRPTLYRLFSREGGLATYIRTCRLREATALLLQSDCGEIVDIAYYVGFRSASDFSRAFRRVYGMAPSAYRRACLQGAVA